jgi:hypothetical protein
MGGQVMNSEDKATVLIIAIFMLAMVLLGIFGK